MFSAKGFTVEHSWGDGQLAQGPGPRMAWPVQETLRRGKGRKSRARHRVV